MPREVQTAVALRWRDIDDLGHVNQSVYHELLEEGRGALFAPLIEAAGAFSFVLARVELDYRHEVRRADDSVTLRSRIAKLGRTSVTVDQSVSLRDGTVAAEGRSVLVAWDAEARRSRPLTDAERALLGD